MATPLEIEQKTGFHPDQVYMILDYETYSEADIKSLGSYEYARHPSTEIICIGWRIGTREKLRRELENDIPAKGWISGSTERQPQFTELFQSFMHPHIILVAHNAFFEKMITRFVFAQREMYSEPSLARIPDERWICTATLAATLAIPRGLEGAADALKLEIRKDMEGAKLLKKMMRPAKPTKNDTNVRRHRDNPENIKRLLEYCKTDVDAETYLFLKAPPLTLSERKLWILDQQINIRGFKVDRPLIKRIQKLIRMETGVLDGEASELSGHQVSSARERDSVLAWLDTRGLILKDLKEKTVTETLALGPGKCSKDARRMLELRQAVSKSSTAKYPRFLSSSQTDGRVRDTLVFHSASTGRWGGGRVNPQNFKRPHIGIGVIASVIREIKSIEKGKDEDFQDVLEWIRTLDGNPMAVFSSMLRSMIIPGTGKKFHVADFNAIEVRVLFWLAGHEKGMRAFRNSEPVYEQMASEIFGIPVEEIADGSMERFVGKTSILGCGYGMGNKKFQGTCKDQGGVLISDKLAAKAVQTFRRKHKPVVEFWYELERAAIAAVNHKGQKFTVGHVTWFCWNEFLCCRLPSGRLLYYLKPKIGHDQTPWGDKKSTLYYLGVDKTKKKMTLEKTYGGKLAENICQAVSRDVMASSMQRLQRAGHWDIILTVHDEIISETNVFDEDVTLDDYIDVMQTPPGWGLEIPLLVKGYESERYRK